MKHTKGKVKLIKSDISIMVCTVEGLGLGEVYIGDRSTEEIQEAEANAELIAEAFNVTNECGLTPRELLAQRDELLKALLKADDILDDSVKSEYYTDSLDKKQIKQASNNTKKL